MAQVIVPRGVWLACLTLVHCSSRSDPPLPTPPPAAVVQPQASSGDKIDLIDSFSHCEVRHRGLLLDLGSPSVDGRSGWRLGPENNTVVEREGSSWLRVASRSISYRFTLQETQPVFLSGKIRSLGGKSASVLLDGKVMGSLSLVKGQSKVSSTGVFANPLAPGNHLLTVRFAGGSREGVDPLAEVDWLRVGFPDEDSSMFAAPTQHDVLQNLASLGDVAHRSLALRAPSLYRCFLGIPGNSRLRMSLAMLGGSEGEAEIRMTEEGQPANVLKTSRLLGSEKPVWTDLDLPIHQHAGKLMALDIAVGGPPGSRFLVGDPQILVGGTPRKKIPRAKAVVIVVVSSVNPERLPPWAPDRPLPTFDALAREGVVFDRYRVPSSLPNGVMASLLTGLTPRQHTVEDAFARVPESLPTLATVAKDASIQTAMFTVHPMTAGAFGFARGWDRFAAHSPISPALGTRPIEELISWLNEQGPRADKGLLAVLHTRGIHPPYDLSPGEFAQLPPHPEQEYSGPLDPRRAGQVLARLRKKKGPQRTWTDTDALRLQATLDVALAQTDRNLSNLIDALRKARLWNDTLLIVTSDVASATNLQVIPFAPVQDPSEEVLRAPLYVHFPGGEHAGKRLQIPTTTQDLTTTAMLALGLDAALPPGGEDLFALVERGGMATDRHQVASLGEKLVVRWGDWRLSARDGVAPQLCDLRADPVCEKNLAESFPMVTEALWRHAFDHEKNARPPRFERPRREPATLDQDTVAALNVWGHGP